jgi:hypothetical protein
MRHESLSERIDESRTSSVDKKCKTFQWLGLL